MGLDIEFDCWHGPYSAFNRWRNAVAEAAGYEIVPSRSNEYIRLPRIIVEGEEAELWTLENCMGEWERLPEDPMLVLIVHSDCDGRIPHEATRWLADRLERILPLISDQEEYPKSHRELTQQFINGLREANAAGEDVEFY